MSANTLPYALIIGMLTGPGVAPTVLAQDAAVREIEEVVTVGSRLRRGRSTADSLVPVDVISAEEFENQGNTDMDDMLATLIPSYNVGTQPISDEATFIRPANLRGLAGDQTLVLVNGKRRHRAAVISFLGGGISDGAQGPDLSVIPGIALQRVEVLRDGASSQYGSDAIAGVMNFVLRDDSSGGRLEARWGQTYEGDGDSLTIAANIGVPLTDAGFANFSVELNEVDPTVRSVQRADAAALIAAGNSAVREPYAQIWGSPEIDDNFKFFGNAGLDLGNGSEAYMFGNWAKRQSEGGFYFRNPNTRSGVFEGASSNTIRVADLSDDGLSGNCPVVNIVNNVPNPGALAAVAANPDCFAFNERFPGGFTPQFGGFVDDLSLAAGVRGEFMGGWYYDLSAMAGRSNIDFYIYNTINPQLADQRTNIPIYYKPGSYTETDRVFNLDLSREFDIGNFYSPVNLGLGLEYRDERFQLEPGEEQSWYIDDSRARNLAQQGFGIGSNGFVGFPPRAASDTKRGSYAGYIDLEAEITERWILGVAWRYEDYEGIGSTSDGKLAARFQAFDGFALRGSASTGFKAPTVGQANVIKVTTAIDPVTSKLADEATLSPTHPISVLKGGKALQPEESVNLSFGAVFDIGALDVTIDYYNINVTDRIARSAQKVLTGEDIAILIAQGIPDATAFTSVRFYTNEYETTTQGIDLVVTWPFSWGSGDTELTFVGNWNETTVDDFNPAIVNPLVQVRQLEEALPEYRFTLTGTHIVGPWRFQGRGRYYDEFFEAHGGVATFPFISDAKFFLDAEAAYTFNDSLSLAAGVHNLLDEYPSENPFQQVYGAKYAESSPYGFNGGFYYLRASLDF